MNERRVGWTQLACKILLSILLFFLPSYLGSTLSSSTFSLSRPCPFITKTWVAWQCFSYCVVSYQCLLIGFFVRMQLGPVAIAAALTHPYSSYSSPLASALVFLLFLFPLPPSCGETKRVPEVRSNLLIGLLPLVLYILARVAQSAPGAKKCNIWGGSWWSRSIMLANNQVTQDP